jgi:hypothetical protein
MCRLVRDGAKKITLAVGDGANDVSMIQVGLDATTISLYRPSHCAIQPETQQRQDFHLSSAPLASLVAPLGRPCEKASLRVRHTIQGLLSNYPERKSAFQCPTMLSRPNPARMGWPHCLLNPVPSTIFCTSFESKSINPWLRCIAGSTCGSRHKRTGRHPGCDGSRFCN